MKEQIFRLEIIGNILIGRMLLFICLLISSRGAFAQTNLFIEAESGTLLGTANITSCANASGGQMVRDIDDGTDNALED